MPRDTDRRETPERPTTVGVWVGDESDLIERFDELMKHRTSGSYSRSRKITDAMELYLVVEEYLQSADYDIDSERSKRHHVRQALLELDRRERERE